MLRSELLRKENRMGHSENYWISHDGLKLYAQTWAPAEKQKALINIIHGLGEHSSRFENWAKQLADNGFIVRSFDLRGHGHSEGKRGYISDYEVLLKDISQFLYNGIELFPSLPIFLYGHSLGGNLLLNLSIQTSLPVNGLIVTSPWLELTEPPSKGLLILVNILRWFLPGFQVNSKLRAEDLSRDLRIVHLYKTDPLVHNQISLKFFLQAYEAGLKAAKSIYKINVPLLVMHGTSDNITSCKATREFVRNASSKTTFIDWQEGFHELHNDLDKEKVFRTILDWLNRYL